MKIFRFILLFFFVLSLSNVIEGQEYNRKFHVIPLDKPIMKTYPDKITDVGNAYAIDSAIVDPLFYYILKKIIDVESTSDDQNVILLATIPYNYFVGFYNKNDNKIELQNNFSTYFKYDNHNIFVQYLIKPMEIKSANKRVLLDKQHFKLLSEEFEVTHVNWACRIEADIHSTENFEESVFR